MTNFLLLRRRRTTNEDDEGDEEDEENKGGKKHWKEIENDTDTCINNRDDEWGWGISWVTSNIVVRVRRSSNHENNNNNNNNNETLKIDYFKLF